jgi:NADH-quinone oxidoreductase subunit N
MDWFKAADLAALSPLIILAVGAFGVLLADAIAKGLRTTYVLPFASIGTVGLAALAVVATWSTPGVAAGGSLILGPYTTFISILCLAAAAIAFLYSVDYARRLGFELGEYYGLLLLSTTGMLYFVAANDLVSLFIGFELMSLSIYALVGVSRIDMRAGEAAMKYFLLGSFSSAFLLYGLALLYGATGTIYLSEMHVRLGGLAPTGIALGAVALLITGFAFKIGAVPFHAWIPDAYEGAPAAVTGFMAVAVKAAAFAVFIRVLHVTGLLASATPGSEVASSVLWILAVATMVIGNFAALAQTSIQRLLAYSGIAHSGYVLVGLVAATEKPAAATGALFYLVGYAAMTIGAFAVLTTIRRDGRTIDRVDDLAGLARERPGAAVAMTIFMVSLIGIPPTAGFMGKLWIFRAAVEAGFTQLVVIAVLTTAVSVYYYLRVVVVMYMTEPEIAPAPAPVSASFGGSFAVALAAAATLLFGMFPSATLDAAARSVGELMSR